MNFADFGMDTASLAGTLERKLAAVRDAGFAQVMISAADVVAHPLGADAGARCVRASGLRITGLESLCDFEGLDGQLHAYKVDVAKSMLEVCWNVDGRMLLVEATTSTHADPDSERTIADLRKLATLAIPLGIRIAYRARAGSRTAPDVATARDLVFRAASPNLGLAVDLFDVLATKTPQDEIDAIDPEQTYLVQLSDFMWNELRSPAEREATATRFRVFPGEGAHSDALADLVRQVDRLGYFGDYSFDVYNDDYLKLPAEAVAERARRAADWLGETVLRRALPVPNVERLRRAE